MPNAEEVVVGVLLLKVDEFALPNNGLFALVEDDPNILLL